MSSSNPARNDIPTAKPPANKTQNDRPDRSSTTLVGLTNGFSDGVQVIADLASLSEYKILRELGRGGMGIVYLAKYLPMDRYEVLKVLNEQMIQRESARERFVTEMRAIARLNHPSIATAYQQLPLPNQLVFSMEYVPGVNLHQFTATYHPMPIPVCCELASQIAAALQHAFTREMVHRDIKPSNIMVFEEDGKRKIKILDFGLAKATKEQKTTGLTAHGTMLGTPEYMAPEQALDAATADIRADIYSLGCTLYHMLVGHPPFPGNYKSILMSHAMKQADDVHLQRGDVPAELSDIITKMMAKVPSKRYQTPSDVAAALKPFRRSAAGEAVRINTAEVDTRHDLASPSRHTLLQTFDHPSAAKAPSNLPPIVSVKPRSQRRKPTRITPILIGLAFLAAFLFAVTLTFRTRSGTLVIENLPPEATVAINGDHATIKSLDSDRTAEVRLVPGTHQVEVKIDGTVILGETVSIKSGDRLPIRIKREKEVGTPRASDELNFDSPSVPTISNIPPDRVNRLAEYRFGSDWTIENNELVHRGAGREHWLTFGDRSWEDYEFTYEVQMPRRYDCFSTLFRVADDSSLLQWGLGWLGGKAVLEHQSIKERHAPLEPAKPAVTTRPGQWHQVRTVVEGSTMAAFFDDQLIWEHDNLPLHRGAVGVRVYSSDDAHLARFRKLEVRTLDGKALWSGIPELPLTRQQIEQEVADLESENLLINGDAEQFDQNDMPIGWTQVSGRFRCVPHSRENAGYCFGVGNNRGSVDEIEQSVSLTDYSDAIERGNAKCRFSAKAASGWGESGRIDLQFVDDKNKIVSAVPIASVCNSLGWKVIDRLIDVPPKSREVKVTLSARRFSGLNTQVWFDRLVLKVADLSMKQEASGNP